MPDSMPSGVQRGFTALALTQLLACIWAMTHVYRALTADATLYAFQALARLHPWLSADIYLQNASQDSYTVFTWFYAKLIGAIGLHQAARSLYVVFAACFLAASWTLARRLSDSKSAWFAVVLLTILVAHYGSYNVFRIAEDFMTARALAEALVVTAIACFYLGARSLAVAIATAALFIHPLMALPGLLLLICLWAGPRISVASALGGICLTALVAVGARHAAHSQGVFALIDGTWLTVVRERSQYLFLQLWRATDWEENGVPFASLVLTLAVVTDQRQRQFAWVAMLVGATGLAIALIASNVGPIAILLQGQAWRWMWITSFASILLLAPTLLSLWRDTRCGPACALLLIGGWTCDFLNIWYCIALVLLLWMARERISDRTALFLRWAALVLALILLAWTIGLAWSTLHNPPAELTHESAPAAALRHILRLRTIPLMAFGLAYWWISTRRSALGPAIACLMFGSLAALAWSGAWQEISKTGDPGDIASYADWRNAMPLDSNVAILGVHNSAGFAWFTLDRADYLSIDQSSGVVFSRATALEVQRRSTVLEPLVRPSWKIMTYLARWASGERDDEKDLPLTAAALTGMCRDPQLNFVIARESVGFDPLRHTGAGPYKDWYLYDCRHVRSPGQSA